ncbi:hypothetical protein MnTg02_01319 [bacterium MnTg02]|nr:hypothetical protein MnTg02_01319 [bacterium MnTg02]
MFFLEIWITRYRIIHLFQRLSITFQAILINLQCDIHACFLRLA